MRRILYQTSEKINWYNTSSETSFPMTNSGLALTFPKARCVIIECSTLYSININIKYWTVINTHFACNPFVALCNPTPRLSSIIICLVLDSSCGFSHIFANDDRKLPNNSLYWYCKRAYNLITKIRKIREGEQEDKEKEWREKNE